jgi:hypothetical protein
MSLSNIKYSGDGTDKPCWVWNGDWVSDADGSKLFEIAESGDDAHRYLDYIDLHLASCSPVMYQALQMLIRYDAIKDESDLDRAIRLATDVFVRHETLCNGLSEGMEDWNL